MMKITWWLSCRVFSTPFRAISTWIWEKANRYSHGRHKCRLLTSVGSPCKFRPWPLIELGTFTFFHPCNQKSRNDLRWSSPYSSARPLLVTSRPLSSVIVIISPASTSYTADLFSLSTKRQLNRIWIDKVEQPWSWQIWCQIAGQVFQACGNSSNCSRRYNIIDTAHPPSPLWAAHFSSAQIGAAVTRWRLDVTRSLCLAGSTASSPSTHPSTLHAVSPSTSRSRAEPHACMSLRQRIAQVHSHASERRCHK